MIRLNQFYYTNLLKRTDENSFVHSSLKTCRIETLINQYIDNIEIPAAERINVSYIFFIPAADPKVKMWSMADTIGLSLSWSLIPNDFAMITHSLHRHR